MLRPGVHALGGRAPDAVPLDALANQPRAATLTVLENGTTTLQRTTASVVVRLDGEPVGVGPVVLHPGTHIDFGDCRLVFELDSAVEWQGVTDERPTPRSSGERARVLTLHDGARGRPSATGQAPTSEATRAAQQGALVSARTGARHSLGARRVLIGRDEACDVVVHGNSVSRRHASIVPVAGGFMLRDESANGTLVNGVRVVGTYLLGHGDVVCVQDEELRVELADAVPVPSTRGEMTTQLDLSRITRGVTEEQARAAANRMVAASLEIVRGPFAGACFQIERPVCSIGRGEENDVRIRDDTVSSTHASLLLKRGSWFVVDLRSMNGTFVDGSRVSGERELHQGTRLRVGAVELVFRAVNPDHRPPADAPRGGLWARIRRMFRRQAAPAD